ncbi:MAG: aspartyl/asparaginyl beta-hydroxylase domain-containing protein [Microthrixaceae bacterium]
MLLDRPARLLLGLNNALVARGSGDEANPRPVDDLLWNQRLVERAPELRAEWFRFRTAGGRLPRIEDVLGEHQGNTEVWGAGLLWSRGRPAGPLLDRFPLTVDALRQVPGLRSALWSVLAPGTELPEHTGPDAGVLRYHLGIDCPPHCALRVGDVEVPYRDGVGILFDDTAPHAAWNRSSVERVTLFCEIERPVGWPASAVNRLTHALLALDPRYGVAPDRATAWDRSLNRTVG